MPYRPVSDQEWQYLRRRFRGLWGGRMDERGRMVSRTEQEIRDMFNEGLPDSAVSQEDRIRSKTIVRERVRELSIDAYNDPYFELEWERAVTANPQLDVWPGMPEARRLLWEAYYRRDDTEAKRKQARSAWRKLSGSAPRTDDNAWEDT